MQENQLAVALPPGLVTRPSQPALPSWGYPSWPIGTSVDVS